MQEPRKKKSDEHQRVRKEWGKFFFNFLIKKFKKQRDQASGKKNASPRRVLMSHIQEKHRVPESQSLTGLVPERYIKGPY